VDCMDGLCPPEQCNNVYQHLRFGLPRLPMLREIAITDAQPPISSTALDPNHIPQVTSQESLAEIRDGATSLLTVLRALAAASCTPSIFSLSVQNCFPGVKTKSCCQKAVACPPVSIFGSCLASAPAVLKKSHRLSLSTQAPEAKAGPKFEAEFGENLSSFILTAGESLRELEINVQGASRSSINFGKLLLSTTLFHSSPNQWPHLRHLLLEGVGVDGRELVVFLGRQSSLEELMLRRVYLTGNSPNWTEVIEDLRLTLGGSAEKPAEEAIERPKATMPLERIIIDLDQVFEPSDRLLEVPIVISTTDLKEYFAGREENPLRTCYETFTSFYSSF
jgi:hypothetical protein